MSDPQISPATASATASASASRQRVRYEGGNALSLVTEEEKAEIMQRIGERFTSVQSFGGVPFDYTRESSKIKERAYDREIEMKLITSPVEWLRQRDEDLTRIEKAAEAFANDAYRKYVTVYEYSHDDAKKMALQSGDAVLEVMLKEHQIKYPEKDYQQVKERRLKYSA